MKQLLLYNLKNKTGEQIEQLCAPLHIGVLHIQSADYLEQIGVLTGHAGFVRKGAPACSAVFADEMMLFSELPPKEIHTILDALRGAGISIALKAVLTKHNIHWNSLQLHKELSEERQSMKG